MRKPYIIIGGGITGLTVGYALSKEGLEVIIIEKENVIGGLAKSFKYRDFVFDIGPHRFYTTDVHILQFINNILRDEKRIIRRHSGVYLFGKYYTWPLRPLTLLRLPLNVTLNSGFDLLFKRISKKTFLTNTLENYIIKRYGPTLYNVFFRDYTEKFLGILANQTHADWAETGIARAVIDERIASRNLLDILKSTVIPKPIQTEFIYPEGGIGVFCNRLAEEIKANGGIILTDTKVKGLESSKGNIDTVVCDKGSYNPEKVIWTAPIGEAYRLLNFSGANLAYLSLLLYFVEINGTINNDYQWCYFGQRDIIFNRISIPYFFNSSLAPKDRIGLCIEVTCRENDRIWNRPEDLINQIKRDLIKVGFVEDVSSVGLIHIERISNAYPMYKLDYHVQLNKSKQNLSRFRNFILAGRTGLFWYNNMDDCIENGLVIAKELIHEREYAETLIV